jgi:biopolymer transport protein ExbB
MEHEAIQLLDTLDTRPLARPAAAVAAATTAQPQAVG